MAGIFTYVLGLGWIRILSILVVAGTLVYFLHCQDIIFSSLADGWVLD